MLKKISPYWLCQIGGWLAYCIVWIFIYLTVRTKVQPHFYEVLFCDALIGLAVTHLMRFLIRSLNMLKLPLKKQITNLLILTLVFSFLYAFVCVVIEDQLQLEMESMKNFTLFNKTIRASFGAFLFLLIWNLIYFTYHYVLKSRNDQLDKVRLESLVKELELKTIKSHINPHFIFNALNSIRALVDEDPQRARTAITGLSNILRSSMYAEKLETTRFEKELDIVKDYLALEHIRFEDRLKVEYDIDEDTLDQPVPPMMLQTLVENAIKHGISKQVDGGVIKIKSDFIENHYELVVQNTGHLNGSRNSDGFGIASTQNRLLLLFGSKAKFAIKDTDNNLVEAKVIMPVPL
jgi:sensor histidine kinase YesM